MTQVPHVPPRFREDNTEGYSIAELAELNRRFDRAVADTVAELAPPETDELAFKSWLDRVAETVQAEFDADLRERASQDFVCGQRGHEA